VNRQERAEIDRYVSGGDPEFFEEDFADDDVIDPVELTPAQLAEVDALLALLPVDSPVATFYEEI
jgi:hypothetical protein